MSPILYCKIQDQSLNLHDIYLVYMSIVIRFSVLIYVIISCVYISNDILFVVIHKNRLIYLFSLVFQSKNNFCISPITHPSTSKLPFWTVFDRNFYLSKQRSNIFVYIYLVCRQSLFVYILLGLYVIMDWFISLRWYSNLNFFIFPRSHPSSTNFSCCLS